MESLNETRVLCKLNPLLLFGLCILQAGILVSVNAQSVADSDVRMVMTALRNNNFFTAANVISYVKSYLVPKTTLLVPSDSAIFDVSIAGNVPLQSFPSLLKLHVVEGNLSFDELKLFPMNSWLPTALQNSYLQITNSSSNNVSLNNARIIRPDMCPVTPALLVCHGIDAVLEPLQFGSSSGRGGRGSEPASPPQVPAPSSIPTHAGVSGLGEAPTANSNSSSSFINPPLHRRAVAPAPVSRETRNHSDRDSSSSSSGAEGRMLKQHVPWLINVAITVGIAVLI